MRLTYPEAVQKYGPIENGVWKSEVEWCTKVVTPPELTWIKTLTGHKVEDIYCNLDMACALQNALKNVIMRGLVDQLKTFDGCYMVRDVRGEPGKPSCHSYALAIDINASTNRLGTPGDMTDELAKCFTDVGFTWGKKFRRMDPQHFSYAWE